MSYLPDKAIHPGYTLKKVMDAEGLPSPKEGSHLDKVLKGEENLTELDAGCLEELGAGTKSFWMNHQKNYDETVERLKSNQSK